jgi:hypothetical protein
VNLAPLDVMSTARAEMACWDSEPSAAIGAAAKATAPKAHQSAARFRIVLRGRSRRRIEATRVVPFIPVLFHITIAPPKSGTGV